MELVLKRTHKFPTFTIGELSLDGSPLKIFTLEDTERLSRPASVKIAGRTAIPYGRYKVELTMSRRFKKMLPILIDVPRFQGVRVHTGNASSQTEGCILVGLTWDGKSDWIGSSSLAYEKLLSKLNFDEEVWLTIS